MSVNLVYFVVIVTLASLSTKYLSLPGIVTYVGFDVNVTKLLSKSTTFDNEVSLYVVTTALNEYGSTFVKYVAIDTLVLRFELK